ncbi:unnamed protein product [Linum tenue]|uniref:Uncharacterized protein n=1 Tax=Linum tenue TaxID=586396 RepID=A0AAV0PGC9_9ROSI|nr:unnamed protein product [Linum tenue]
MLYRGKGDGDHIHKQLPHHNLAGAPHRRRLPTLHNRLRAGRPSHRQGRHPSALQRPVLGPNRVLLELHGPVQLPHRRLRDRPGVVQRRRRQPARIPRGVHSSSRPHNVLLHGDLRQPRHVPAVDLLRDFQGAVPAGVQLRLR